MPAPDDAILSGYSPALALAAYLDISGDVVRSALSPVPISTPASTILPAADPDFDGKTFSTLDPKLISVSPIAYSVGGVQGVEFTLSGTLELDASTLTALSDPALFFGRTAKIWLVRLNDSWQPTHAAQIFAGYMSVPQISGDGSTQTITVKAETYLAIMAGTPARSLASQSLYDPADLSWDAVVGAGRNTAAAGPYFAEGAIRLPYNFEQGVTWLR